jgi:hypothetical protein
MIGYKAYKTYKSKPEANAVAKKLRSSGKRVTTREVALKGKGVRVRLFVK